MNYDAFFTKGDSHKVCQDYAISGESEQYVYAVVCDGCSSSPKVDIGARLLAELFIANLNRQQPVLMVEDDWPKDLCDSMDWILISQIEKLRSLLALDASSFDSTLLAAIYVKDKNKLLTFQWGDGRVTKKYKDGTQEESYIVYSQNAPAYFSYRAFPDRGELYAKCFGEQEATLHRVYTDKNIVDIETPNTPAHFEITDVENLQYVHLSSDGIESFQDANENHIEVATEFTSFKGFEGEFVQRRMNRFLKNIRKDGAGHYDDLGVAAIYFN